MTISPLPHTTVQALSSSQILIDPISLVKELVENALDARATSISVELSANSIVVIQVKDNGFGIGPDDRALLAQWHCTSKIRNLDDLTDIGGKFLGFRGVALASAAEMSGSMSISTRVEGELIGEVLRFDREGKLVSRVHKSLPSGATVRVEDFLKSVPVRRQASLKNPPKSLQDEKNKVNWAYGSKSGATIMDAAIQTFGASLVSNCDLKHWTPSLGFIEDASVVQECLTDFKIIAILPKMSCETAAISTSGQHLSIDSRPISSRKGTSKKIVEAFKSHVQHTADSEKKPTSPFLCFNLNCPFGSYDANVEPAKDDVLFNDERRILETCKTFFSAVYGDHAADSTCESAADGETQPASELLLGASKESGPNQERASEIPRDPKLRAGNFGGSNSHIANDEDQVALSASSDSHPNTSICRSQIVKGAPKISFNGENKTPAEWWSSMHQVIEEGQEDSNSADSEDGWTEEENDGGPGAGASDPWVIAKMNAPIRKRKLNGNDSNTADFNGQILTPQKLGVEAMSSPIRIGSDRSLLRNRQANQLPSPQKDFGSSPQTMESSSIQGIPLSRVPLGTKRNQDYLTRLVKPSGLQPKEYQAPIQKRTVDNQNQTLDAWIRKPVHIPLTGTLHQSTSKGFSLNDIPDISQRPRQRRSNNSYQQNKILHKPFVTPRPKNNTQQSSLGFDSNVSQPVVPGKPPLQAYSSSQGNDRALKEIMQTTDHYHRPATRFSHPSPTTYSGSPQPDRTIPQNNLWLSQETSQASNNSVCPTPAGSFSTHYEPQSRSSPFSPSPEPPSMVKLPVLTISSSIAAIRASAAKHAMHDMYLTRGTHARGLAGPHSAGIISTWEERIRSLIAAKGGKWGLDRGLDLRKVLREHSLQD